MQSKKPRLLMVDEEEPVARALTYLLKREGFEVRSVANEGPALEAAREFRPDLILVEVSGSSARGLGILSRIREDTDLRHAAVILVAARSKPRDVVLGLERGADDCIVKPFDPKEVVARLRAQLRIRRLQDQLVVAERSRVLLETAGAVAHEMSQPLTAIMGNLELLLQRMPASAPNRHLVVRIFKSGERAVDLLRKLQRIEVYELKDYPGTGRILDIEKSSRT